MWGNTARYTPSSFSNWGISEWAISQMMSSYPYAFFVGIEDGYDSDGTVFVTKYTTSYRYDYGFEDYVYANKVDGKTVLDPEDDPATVYWGNGWRTPTIDEWIELFTNIGIRANINEDGCYFLNNYFPKYKGSISKAIKYMSSNINPNAFWDSFPGLSFDIYKLNKSITMTASVGSGNYNSRAFCPHIIRAVHPK